MKRITLTAVAFVVAAAVQWVAAGLNFWVGHIFAGAILVVAGTIFVAAAVIIRRTHG